MRRLLIVFAGMLFTALLSISVAAQEPDARSALDRSRLRLVDSTAVLVKLQAAFVRGVALSCEDEAAYQELRRASTYYLAAVRELEVLSVIQKLTAIISAERSLNTAAVVLSEQVERTKSSISMAMDALNPEILIARTEVTRSAFVEGREALESARRALGSM